MPNEEKNNQYIEQTPEITEPAKSVSGADELPFPDPIAYLVQDTKLSTGEVLKSYAITPEQFKMMDGKPQHSDCWIKDGTLFVQSTTDTVRSSFEKTAAKQGLSLDFSISETPGGIDAVVTPIYELEYETPVPDAWTVQDTLNHMKPGTTVLISKVQTEDGCISELAMSAEGKLIAKANADVPALREMVEKMAQDMGLECSYEITEFDVPESSKTPSEHDSPAAEEIPTEPENVDSGVNMGESEPVTEPSEESQTPIDDNLSRNKLLNRMYSPEEIDILRKAANNKPTATLGEDMKRAYASKAPTDAKVGIGDVILGTLWTVLTLPIMIPWNILKAGAVTVGHFANKSKNVRMAKAAVTEVPKYRKEHKKQTVNDKPKTSLFSKLKGFFSKLFGKKDELVAESEKTQVETPNVTAVEEQASKKPLTELIQDAKDTPDKEHSAPVKAREAERE